jgi:hypothetical protein
MLRNKNIKFFLWLIVVFVLATVIWYSPIFVKGYPVQNIDSEGAITIARNYSEHGVLGLENDLSIVVAPSLVESEANTTSLGNKLSMFGYSTVFKTIGPLTWDQIVILAIILHALALIFFTITVFHLFGLKEAMMFSLVYILLPVNWRMTHTIGNYEFALLFFSLFTIFFFCFKDYKTRWLRYILAGLFLGLSGLAREAIFLFFPILFIWLWYYKKKKELILVFVPVIMLLAIFWLPSFFNGGSDYLKLFTETEPEHSDLHYYGHIYSDPYVYNFNKQSVIDEINYNSLSNESGIMYRISRQKAGANMGVRSVNLVERFLGGTVIITRHISKFFAIEDTGGPLTFLLMITGFYYLKRKDKKIYLLFASWIIAVPLLLSYIVLAVRNHLMDFSWVIAALVALGLISFGPLLKDYYKVGKKATLIHVFIILITLYSLVLANHVYFGRAYDDTGYLASKYLAEKIDNYSLVIDDKDVIAVGRRSLHPGLNYLTEKSIVFLGADSIQKMTDDGNLADIFDQFNIRYIIGYDDNISKIILENSEVENVSNWPKQEDIKIISSYAKDWFLNVVK